MKSLKAFLVIISLVFSACSKSSQKWGGVFLYTLSDGYPENPNFRHNDSLYLSTYISRNSSIPINPHFQPADATPVDNFELSDSQSKLSNFRQVIFEPENSIFTVLILDTAFVNYSDANKFLNRVNKMSLYTLSNGKKQQLLKDETFFVTKPSTIER